MTDSPTPLTGQDINVAARATRSVFDSLLRDAGTTFPVWVALNMLGTAGSRLPREVLRRNLTEGLDADPAAVDGLLDELGSAGLAEVGVAAVELTPDGTALHERLRDATADAAARLWSGFDPQDLATTRRVLLEVTERARAQV
jgi:DNA-binding MarR family transcriptional regulator